MANRNDLIATMIETAEAINDLIKKKNDKIYELEKEVTALEDDPANTLPEEIDCGIGRIEYRVVGSLDLVQLMETIGEVIKEQGATALLRHLEEVYVV